jgi:hypothetical protein
VNHDDQRALVADLLQGDVQRLAGNLSGLDPDSLVRERPLGPVQEVKPLDLILGAQSLELAGTSGERRTGDGNQGGRRPRTSLPVSCASHGSSPFLASLRSRSARY